MDSKFILELGCTGLDALSIEGEGKKGLKDDSAALTQPWIEDRVHTRLTFYQIVQWKERCMSDGNDESAMNSKLNKKTKAEGADS